MRTLYRRSVAPIAALILAAASVWVSPMALAARPNVVLIIADDLGFSDIAPYGSEIQTPALSALAQRGIRFTNYHTAASCAPTRGMLLTGVDSHRNGVPNIPETIPPEQAQHANYRGTLGHNVVTVASLLQEAGYHTYLAGKWHLGKTPDLLPFRRGFERTVTMADTGADNWEQKPYIPIYKKANWFADGEPFELPEDFYSSRFLVDKTIEYISSNAGDGQPFFAYLPFQAVHIPVQAPQAFTDKYMETYNEGWEVLRKQRQARAEQLGIIAPGTDMVDMSTTADWESYTAEEQRYHAKRMAVYAGMIDAMDHHIGRLINYLKQTGQYENTVFIFTSDNGSEASGGDDPRSVAMKIALAEQGYVNDYDTLGLKGSFNTIGPSFASAAASPLGFYKFYAGEGGMRVPLIIAGKRIPSSARLTNALAYVTDITPTILDLTGVSPPSERFGGHPVEPIVGRSLLPLVRGDVERVYSETDTIGYELGGNSALFQGDYKIVLNIPPVGDNEWHLYNIVKDPGETRDLKEQMPERFERMLAHYRQYTIDNNVLPLPANYNPAFQGIANGTLDRFGSQILLGLLSLIVLLPFYLAYRSKK
ncbi:Arylsulfatase [Halioglobus japonicus]|nr:Arylsulfatase [Halioglobus japonicus]